MANTIRIARSVTTNTPSSLAQGEPAYSEDGSPNGEGELFIGTAGATVTKITTTVLTGTDGTAAQPNSSAQDNQTITSGTGLDGADGGSATNVTLTLALDELPVATPVTGDWIAFDDAGTSSKALISNIPLSIFNNDSGWTTNTGTVTSVSGGTGVLSTGGTTPTINLDYVGTDNFIDSATNLEGTGIATTDTLIYHDATDDTIKKGLVSDLPFGVGSGDISRVNITAGTGLSGTQDTLTGDHTQTLALDFSELTDMTGDIAGTTEFIVQDTGTESRKAASEIKLSSFSNDSGWTSNSGTVTDVTGGTGVTSTGGTTPSISLDFSELTDMTANIAGTTEFILQNGAVESRKAASEITLSDFNNDSGWDANQTITTGTGIDGSDGGTSGNITVSLALDELSVTSIGASDWIAFDDAGTSSKALVSGIDLALFDNTAGWEANDANTVLTTDTGSASWTWIIDEDAMGSNSATHVPTQQSVKAYVDSAVTGGLTHKGGYNASTDTPALDTGSPTLVTGDMYTVTVAGTFFTVALEVGDVLIADVDSTDAAALADWTIVQANIGAASETAAGYIELATQGEMDTATDDTRAVTPLKYANSTIDGGTF